MTQVRITIIYDDYNGAEKNYRLSFGFAVLIEKDDRKFLFDTGTEPDALLHNLDTYGLSPSEIDAIILSHNHYDHTNGLLCILKKKIDIPIYVHKYWNVPVSFQGLNLPQKNVMINQKARECKELCPGIFLTNPYPSNDYGGIYEQACYIQSTESNILICGCCHPGLIEFLKDRKILGISEDTSLHIIGGLHGFEFNNEQAQKVDKILKSIIICHCSMNYQVYKAQFGNKCFKGMLGKTLIYS